MVNKLCNVCVRTCKQDDLAKIVSCPKFLKKPTDREFHDMLHELDKNEKHVKTLQKNVKEIIKHTLSEHSPEPNGNEETEIDEESD